MYLSNYIDPVRQNQCADLRSSCKQDLRSVARKYPFKFVEISPDEI